MTYPPQGPYPYGYPPYPQKKNTAFIVLIALLTAVVILLVVGGAFFILSKNDVAQADVTAEPVSTATNPFMPAVGTDQAGVTPPTPAVTTNPVTPPVQRYSGGTEGLYGGTNNYHQCDSEKLINFLTTHTDKGYEWARVLGINFSDIRTYVNSLTPVTLRSDTYVTNHGWINGRANSFVSVLEAGTSVFVNKYGEPVVKCFCGNPLTPWYPPTHYKPHWKCSCSYPQPYWPQWGKTTIVIVERTVTIIDRITIIDYNTGKALTRPTGPKTVDSPYVPPGSTPSAPPSPYQSDTAPPQPSYEPPPQQTYSPPQQPRQPQYTGADAVSILKGRIQSCESRGVRYPWSQAVSQSVNYYQAGTSSTWVVSVTDHPASDPDREFTFVVDIPNKTVAPNNDWANRAAQYCPELNQ